jgi:hypothetical protein
MPRRRERLGRAAAGVALFAVLSGCIGGVGGGGSPHNLMLTVANEGTTPASVSWARPGLLGTPLFPDTGTDAIQGCDVYWNGFGAGHNEVLIKVGGQSLNLVFDLTSMDQISRFVVITPDGSISEVDEHSMPTTGCGANTY